MAAYNATLKSAGSSNLLPVADMHRHIILGIISGKILNERSVRRDKALHFHTSILRLKLFVPLKVQFCLAEQFLNVVLF